MPRPLENILGGHRRELEPKPHKTTKKKITRVNKTKQHTVKRARTKRERIREKKRENERARKKEALLDSTSPLPSPSSVSLPFCPRPLPHHPHVSSFPGHDPWGGTPPLDHGRALATYDWRAAAEHRLCLSSCSPLPAPCSPKTSHPASHPHNTLACNHTTHPPPPRPHLSTS